MKKIKWGNLSLLVIDFILVGYIMTTIIGAMNGAFIGIPKLCGIFLAAIFAEPITEEIVRILNK